MPDPREGDARSSEVIGATEETKATDATGATGAIDPGVLSGEGATSRGTSTRGGADRSGSRRSALAPGAHGISGMVCSASRCAPITGVRVSVLDGAGRARSTTRTGEDGRWRIESACEDDRLRFECAGFVAKDVRVAQAKDAPASASTGADKIRLLENELIGYQRRLWFHPGETVEAYVHSPGPFVARLCRHGERWERAGFEGDFPPQVQQVPDGHFVETGLDWRPSFSYTVPSSARPGLYSLRLEADGQEPFAIPMVVSTPPEPYGRRARLLVLASTNNWQSYNIWGGRNRYRNHEDGDSPEFFAAAAQPGLIRRMVSRIVPQSGKNALRSLLRRPATDPTPPWAYRKLSILRPFTNCSLEETDPLRPFTNHLAAGEWRLLAWLEREGYAYDIVAGYELDRHPSLLEHYDAVVLNTHSEYWSRRMFEGLRRFHEAQGGWVINLSGNSIFREVEFFEDGSHRCVSVSFRDSCADETQIVGCRFSMSDYGTCAPYRVVRPGHWVFTGAGVTRGARFGLESLNRNTRNTPPRSGRWDPGRPGLEAGLAGTGASGWETDKKSRTAPRDMMVVAKGCNPRGGADMVVRVPAGSRGGMFSASSIVFGGCLLIDEVASGIVRAVLNRALSRADDSYRTSTTRRV